MAEENDQGADEALPQHEAAPPAAAQPAASSDAAGWVKKYKKLQREHSQLQADLSAATARIAQLKHERNVFLDALYENEVATVDVSGSSECEDERPILESNSSAVLEREDDEEQLQSGEDIPLPPAKSATTPAKRKKQVRPISETVYRVTPVPVDLVTGEVSFPLTVGLHTVHELGKVLPDRPGFHNNRYIFPVGFHTSRSYFSIVNPEASTIWHSRVLDGEGAGPIFEVYPEDDPESATRGSTSTGVWSAIMRQAAAIRNREPAGSASGPDFFGFGSATIMQLIEQLPGADQCRGYERKRFEMMSFPVKRAKTASTSSAAPHTVTTTETATEADSAIELE